MRGLEEIDTGSSGDRLPPKPALAEDKVALINLPRI
jgi:hypothetical protein